MGEPLVARLADLPPDERRDYLRSLDPDALRTLAYDWRAWARDEQRAPEWAWTVWLILAGRGFGKTRTGAEWVHEQAREQVRIALVGRTAPDVRDVMVEGPSGILATAKPGNIPTYQPSKRRIVWPSGAIATTFSADEPDLLRGPEFHRAWCDELAAWRKLEDAWANLMLGVRLGVPQIVVTTTPKPRAIIRDLVRRADQDVAVVRGSTFDNVDNLAPAFFDEIVGRYEGTTLGRQEIHAELLDEMPGALWRRGDIHHGDVPKQLDAVVVGVDPAMTSKETSDETGIVVSSRAGEAGYVLDDQSGRYTPHDVATTVGEAYDAWEADAVIVEVNNGGEWVRDTIKQVRPDLPVRMVSASRGKRTRAEPIAALYEQGRVTHRDAFGTLEDQLCTWEPNTGESSPDRLDALVWGMHALFVGGKRSVRAVYEGPRKRISPY